jgi:hypothetical protein
MPFKVVSDFYPLGKTSKIFNLSEILGGEREQCQFPALEGAHS